MPEETLFQEALARSPAERAAFLEQACAGRPEARAAVAALLAAHEKSSNILDKPPGDLGQTVDSDPGAPDHGATYSAAPGAIPRQPIERWAYGIPPVPPGHPWELKRRAKLCQQPQQDPRKNPGAEQRWNGNGNGRQDPTPNGVQKLKEPYPRHARRLLAKGYPTEEFLDFLRNTSRPRRAPILYPGGFSSSTVRNPQRRAWSCT
jgi:hypothetical protein